MTPPHYKEVPTATVSLSPPPSLHNMCAILSPQCIGILPAGRWRTPQQEEEEKVTFVLQSPIKWLLELSTILPGNPFYKSQCPFDIARNYRSFHSQKHHPRCLSEKNGCNLLSLLSPSFTHSFIPAPFVLPHSIQSTDHHHDTFFFCFHHTVAPQRMWTW